MSLSNVKEEGASVLVHCKHFSSAVMIYLNMPKIEVASAPESTC